MHKVDVLTTAEAPRMCALVACKLSKAHVQLCFKGVRTQQLLSSIQATLLYWEGTLRPAFPAVLAYMHQLLPS